MSAGRPDRAARRRLCTVLLLCGLATWATLHSPTIVFDQQILLGPSLGVLALMEFGWLGLPVGISAAAATIPLWGHPWAAIVLVAQLLWQQLFFSQYNGGRSQIGNGRIVVATIAFWVVLGMPLKALLYSWHLQLDWQSISTLAVKEAVVSVVNASLALLAFLALQAVGIQGRKGDVSLRGLTFASQLLLISLPGILILAATGQQITRLTLQQFQSNLKADLEIVRTTLRIESISSDKVNKLANSISSKSREPIALEIQRWDGRQYRSDPALFQELNNTFIATHPLSGVENRDLSLYVSKDKKPVVSRWLNSYWSYKQELDPSDNNPWMTITLVKPARSDIGQLIGQLGPPLRILALLLIGAALASELFTTLLSLQFTHILRSFSSTTKRGASSDSMPLLQTSNIQELNGLINVINDQAKIVNHLTEELNLANDNLRTSEQQHRLLADNAPDVITIWDERNQITYISPAIKQLRGWSPEEAMNLPLRDQLKPSGWQEIQAIQARIEQALKTNQPLPRFRLELEQSHREGGWVWTDATMSCMVNEANQYIATLMVYRNISDQKNTEQALRAQALTDHLTGLLNRRALVEYANQLLKEFNQHQSDQTPAFLFCDLDFFKEVNDSLGHAAGDAVLQITAQRMLGILREHDKAARIGGDEIVVVLNGVPDIAAALTVAAKIQHVIATPMLLETGTTSISASIGVTLARPGDDAETLMNRADRGMYRAKQSGRGRTMAID
jgi:diguanylate cyclase (GGDEF)-like protein/PAS domain S-box-containing protein